MIALKKLRANPENLIENSLILDTDIGRYISHFFLFPRSLRCHTLSASSKDRILIPMTSYEFYQLIRKYDNPDLLINQKDDDHYYSIWKEPLPSLDSLFPETKQVQAKSYIKSISTSCWIPEKSPVPQLEQSPSPEFHFEEVKVNKIEEKKEHKVESITQSTYQPVIATKAKSSVFNLNSQGGKRKNSNRKIQDYSLVYDQVLPDTSIFFKGFGSFIMPRGTRSQRDYMMKNQYKEKKLSNKHQVTVDKLFDDKQNCKVPYRTYHFLIKSLGGSFIKKASSHRVIKDDKDHTIASIFMHGENQKFGKKYIPYLLLPLLFLGGRPSKTV